MSRVRANIAIFPITRRLVVPPRRNDYCAQEGRAEKDPRASRAKMPTGGKTCPRATAGSASRELTEKLTNARLYVGMRETRYKYRRGWRSTVVVRLVSVARRDTLLASLSIRSA